MYKDVHGALRLSSGRQLAEPPSILISGPWCPVPSLTQQAVHSPSLAPSSAVSESFQGTCPPVPWVALYLGLSPRAAQEGGELLPRKGGQAADSALAESETDPARGQDREL